MACIPINRATLPGRERKPQKARRARGYGRRSGSAPPLLKCDASRVNYGRAMESPAACPICGHRARVDIRLRSDERGDVALARVSCGRPYCASAATAEAMQPHKGLGPDAAIAADVARARAVALWNVATRRQPLSSEARP